MGYSILFLKTSLMSLLFVTFLLSFFHYSVCLVNILTKISYSVKEIITMDSKKWLKIRGVSAHAARKPVSSPQQFLAAS